MINFRYVLVHRARSSAGEHYVDIVGVAGSIPAAPTTYFSDIAKTDTQLPCCDPAGLCAIVLNLLAFLVMIKTLPVLIREEFNPSWIFANVSVIILVCLSCFIGFQDLS